MKKVFIIAAAAAMFSFAASAQTKFAHVNFSELVQLSRRLILRWSSMRQPTRRAQETYSSMLSEFQSKYDQYNEKQATWTPAVRESKQRELNDIQTRIQEFQQAIQQDRASSRTLSWPLSTRRPRMS